MPLTRGNTRDMLNRPNTPCFSRLSLGNISAKRSGGTGQWTNKAFSQASCIIKPVVGNINKPFLSSSHLPQQLRWCGCRHIGAQWSSVSSLVLNFKNSTGSKYHCLTLSLKVDCGILQLWKLDKACVGCTLTICRYFSLSDLVTTSHFPKRGKPMTLRQGTEFQIPLCNQCLRCFDFRHCDATIQVRKPNNCRCHLLE